MLLTEEKKTEYKNNINKLREDIKELVRRSDLSEDEIELLKELREFRYKNFQGHPEAWYDYFDNVMLFD